MILVYASILGLLIAAVAFIVPMLRSAKRQRVQSAWTPLEGTVLEHRMRNAGDGGGCEELRVRFDLAGRSHEAWCGSPDGRALRNYFSSRGEPADRYLVRGAVKKFFDKRPVGSKLAIRVNPADPAQAIYVKRELPALALAIVTGAIFLGFILFAAIIGTRIVNQILAPI